MVHALHAARQRATRGQVQRAQRGAAAQQAGQRFQVHARTGQVQLSKNKSNNCTKLFRPWLHDQEIIHADLDPEKVL